MAGRIQVEVVIDDKIVETKAFGDEVIEIGKLSRSHLRLDDENVSRKHARIEVDKDGRVQLIDLASTNGTRLNGMRVNKAFLSDGDEIEIGVTRLRLRFDAELRKVAMAHARSSRTELSREGFYRNQEAARTGRLALEGALLWEDSPVQVDAFERTSKKEMGLRLVLGLLFAAAGAVAIYPAFNPELLPRFNGRPLHEVWALIWGAAFFTVASYQLYSLVPFRLRALFAGLFGLSPLVFWGSAVLLALGGQTSAAIGVGAGGLGLAVYFLMDIDAWRNMITHSFWRLRRGEAIHVGETHNCRFFLPGETLGATEYPLLVPYRGGWALNLRHKEIKGDVLHGGKVLTVAEARAKGLVKGDMLPMAPGTKCRLRFGQFSMLLSYVPVPKRPKGGFISQLNVAELGYMALSLMIHFGLLILFVYLQPEDDMQIRRKDNSLLARMVQVESTLAKEKEEEEEKEEELEPEEEKDKKKLQDPEDSMIADSDVNDKEDEESPDVLEKEKEPAKRPTNLALQKVRNRKEAKRVSDKFVPPSLIANVTSANLRPAGNSGIKVIGGPGGGDPSETAGFAGEMSTGEGGGFGQLADMGGTLGAGQLGPGGTQGGFIEGLGKVENDGKDGRFGKVRFKEKKQRAVVTTGRVSVSGGALTRAIIRKYINRQKGAIIYCYKRQVQKKPNLAGKVVVAFTISPTGKVMRPGIKSSTLGDSTVEGCIKKRLAFWRFPAPRNAGAVRVSYPFLFKTK